MQNGVCQPVRFTAADGYQLSGAYFASSHADHAVLISPGTGFPKKFYFAMAEYLAGCGASVFVFDYRGIGESAPENLADASIRYVDWGRLDMVAAAEMLQKLSSKESLLHIGHSVGGQFAGLMSNHHLFTKHAFVAVGSGYWRFHKLHYIPVAQFFWWIYGPLSLSKNGYIDNKYGWRGERLPPDIFKTWRRWCHTPNYFIDEFTGDAQPGSFQEITQPIRSWVFTDDPIATPNAAESILRAYPSAAVEVTLNSPNKYGLQQIGHSGAFRRQSKEIWAEIADWLFI